MGSYLTIFFLCKNTPTKPNKLYLIWNQTAALLVLNRIPLNFLWKIHDRRLPGGKTKACKLTNMCPLCVCDTLVLWQKCSNNEVIRLCKRLATCPTMLISHVAINS